MNTEEEKKEKRKAHQKRLVTTENKLRVDGGLWWGEWIKWVMSIKEGTCWDENWVLYVSNESLNSTPEASITPHVN